MYLIWSILNSVLFLYFLYLLVGYVSIGRKVLPKNKLRSLAAILLIFGTVGMFRNETQDEDKTNKSFIINELPEGITKKELPYHNVPSKRLVLEDNVPFDITTRIRVIFVDGKYMAYKSYSGVSGFLSGFRWEQTGSPLVHFDKDGKATYRIDGLLRWNLMGMNVYTESKTFEGTFELDNYKEAGRIQRIQKTKGTAIGVGQMGKGGRPCHNMGIHRQEYLQVAYGFQIVGQLHLFPISWPHAVWLRSKQTKKSGSHVP